MINRGLFAAAIAVAALCGEAQARSLGAAWAPEDPPAALDALPEGSYVRAPMPWSRIEPEPGAREWEVVDTIVEPILERGLRPLLVLGQPPVWAKPQREVRNWWEPCFPGHELCAGEAAYRAKRPAGSPILGGCSRPRGLAALRRGGRESLADRDAAGLERAEH